MGAGCNTGARTGAEVATELSRPRTSWRALFTAPAVLQLLTVTAGRSCGTSADPTHITHFIFWLRRAEGFSLVGESGRKWRWN